MQTKTNPADQGTVAAKRQAHIERQGYKIGDKVFSHSYGKGRITAMNWDTATISWDGGRVTEENAAHIERSTLGHFTLV